MERWCLTILHRPPPLFKDDGKGQMWNVPGRDTRRPDQEAPGPLGLGPGRGQVSCHLPGRHDRFQAPTPRLLPDQVSLGLGRHHDHHRPLRLQDGEKGFEPIEGLPSAEQHRGRPAMPGRDPSGHSQQGMFHRGTGDQEEEGGGGRMVEIIK